MPKIQSCSTSDDCAFGDCVAQICMCAPGYVYEDLSGQFPSACSLSIETRTTVLGIVGALAVVGLLLNTYATYRSAPGLLRYLAFSSVCGTLSVLGHVISLAVEGTSDGTHVRTPRFASTIFYLLQTSITVGGSLLLAMTFTIAVSKFRESVTRATCFYCMLLVFISLASSTAVMLAMVATVNDPVYHGAMAALHFVLSVYCFWYVQFVVREARYLTQILNSRIEQLRKTKSTQSPQDFRLSAMEQLNRGVTFVFRSTCTTVGLAILGFLSTLLMGLAQIMQIPGEPGVKLRVAMWTLIQFVMVLFPFIVFAYVESMNTRVKPTGETSSNNDTSVGPAGGNDTIVNDLRMVLQQAGGGKLYNLLSDSSAAIRFEAHLEAEYAEEHLEFLKSVAYWKRVYSDLTASSATVTAKKILARFIAQGAAQAINISEKLRVQIEEDFQANGAHVRLFDDAVQEVSKILEYGAVTRFQDQEERVQHIMEVDDVTTGGAPRPSRPSDIGVGSLTSSSRGSVLAWFRRGKKSFERVDMSTDEELAYEKPPE